MSNGLDHLRIIGVLLRFIINALMHRVILLCRLSMFDQRTSTHISLLWTMMHFACSRSTDETLSFPFASEATYVGEGITWLELSIVGLRRNTGVDSRDWSCPGAACSSQGCARHCSMVNLFPGSTTSMLSIRPTVCRLAYIRIPSIGVLPLSYKRRHRHCPNMVMGSQILLL